MGMLGSPLFMIAIIFFGYYFLIMMPQKKERAERQKMLDSLKKGDRVVTTSGVHAKVVDISKGNEGEVVTLECSRNVQIDFSRSAIAAVLKRKEDAGSDADPVGEGDSKAGKGKDKRG